MPRRIQAALSSRASNPPVAMLFLKLPVPPVHPRNAPTQESLAVKPGDIPAGDRFLLPVKGSPMKSPLVGKSAPAETMNVKLVNSEIKIDVVKSASRRKLLSSNNGGSEPKPNHPRNVSPSL
jgi:hypothetical protein